MVHRDDSTRPQYRGLNADDVTETISRLAFLGAALLCSWKSPLAAAPPPKPRTLVHDVAQQGVRLRTWQVRARWRPKREPVVLHITCDAASGWPGVQIVPARPWNLTGYDRIAIDVHHRGAAAAKLILVANNPGSDGRKNCSAASRTIRPGEHVAMAVDLGMWHGKEQPFDRANVVSLELMFEHPTGAINVEVGRLRAVADDRRRLDELRITEAFQRLRRPLGRGINLTGLDAPREGAWGLRVEARYLQAIAKAGFDFVRLPVRWSAHTADRPPYRIDETFFRRIDRVVDQARRNNLSIILDVHHFDALLEDVKGQTPRFLAMWRQIGRRYADAPPTVLFELLNEPHEPMTADEWNELVAKGIGVIRERNAKRRIIVGPLPWNAPRGLANLRLPDDPYLIATVHYYAPFRFTHQGATWVGQDTRSWVGTRWGGTAKEREAIRSDLDMVLRWSLRTKRPMLIGEFGVINQADLASRARWARFMRREIEARKMGHAWWDFGGAFAVYDRASERWITPLAAALLGSRRP